MTSCYLLHDLYCVNNSRYYFILGPLSSVSSNIKDTTDHVAKQEKEVVMPKEKEIIIAQNENQNESESRDQLEDLNFGLLRKKNAFLANDISATENAAQSPVTQPKRPASKVFGRISKFKHLKGDVILKGRFENLKNLSKTMPAECNFVQGKYFFFVNYLNYTNNGII